MMICRTKTEKAQGKGHDIRAAGKAAAERGDVRMGNLIDDKKQKEIGEEIMKIFKRHDLSLQEMEFFSRTFYTELKIKLNKKRQKEFANNMMGDMMGKLGLGGG